MAVFTPVSNEEMRQFVAHYPVAGLASFEEVHAGDEDTVYKLETTKGPLFFNLFEEERTEADRNIALSFQQHLNFKHYPCPKVIADDQGEFINQVQQKSAALFSFMPGVKVHKASAIQCYAAGKALAHLHKISENFSFLSSPPHSAEKLMKMQTEIETSTADSLENHSLIHTLRQQTKDMTQNPPPFKRPIGMIHGDFTPENILFMGDEISGVVDFSQAGAETYGYDLAIALNTFGFDEKGDLRISRFQALLAGYEEVRPLSVPERRAFNFELKRAAVWLATRHFYGMLFPKKAHQAVSPEVWFKRLDCHIRRNELADYAQV